MSAPPAKKARTSPLAYHTMSRSEIALMLPLAEEPDVPLIGKLFVTCGDVGTGLSDKMVAFIKNVPLLNVFVHIAKEVMTYAETSMHTDFPTTVEIYETTVTYPWFVTMVVIITALLRSIPIGDDLYHEMMKLLKSLTWKLKDDNNYMPVWLDALSVCATRVRVPDELFRAVISRYPMSSVEDYADTCIEWTSGRIPIIHNIMYFVRTNVYSQDQLKRCIEVLARNDAATYMEELFTYIDHGSSVCLDQLTVDMEWKNTSASIQYLILELCAKKELNIVIKKYGIYVDEFRKPDIVRLLTHTQIEDIPRLKQLVGVSTWLRDIETLGQFEVIAALMHVMQNHITNGIRAIEVFTDVFNLDHVFSWDGSPEQIKGFIGYVKFHKHNVAFIRFLYSRAKGLQKRAARIKLLRRLQDLADSTESDTLNEAWVCIHEAITSYSA